MKPRGVAQASATTVIRPRSGWAAIDFRALCQYRDLLWIFCLRDVQVRYKQTVFGVLWAVVQPLVMMVVMTLIFGKGLKLEDDHIPGVPYAVSYLSAQIVWSFFAGAVNSSANSLVTNAAIVRKIYFPRLIMPIAGLSTALVDFGVAFVVFLVVAASLGVSFSAYWSLLPLVLLSMVLAALGLGLIIAALMVSYRDFRYVVPYLLQVGFFVTPVIWWEEQIERTLGPAAKLLFLNPIAGPVTVFRDVFTGQPLDWTGWALSSAVGLALTVFGALYFTRAEVRFADVA